MTVKIANQCIRLVVTGLFLFSSPLFASVDLSTIPECLDSGKALPIDDAIVLKWKSSTENQFLARAHISGTINKVYADHSGHNHFEIQMGETPTDTLEVVYNISFGTLPALKAGMTVEACGDYITSNAAAQYPASPDGAIIHWIHKNPKGHGHDSGFLVVEGKLFGEGNGHGG